MTRGAQRERDRAKGEKRAAKNGGKAKGDGLSAAARKERDAQKMREKQAAAAEKPKPAAT